MRKEFLLVAGLVLAIAIFHSAGAGTGPPGCSLPTVVDGYAYYANGTPVSGATVTVTTSASSCNSWSSTTESSGYYDVAALDINGKTVTSTAAKSTYDGVNSTTGSGSIQRLNIYMRPKTPALADVANRHNKTGIVLSWISGSESAAGESPYDQLDNTTGIFYTKTSPSTISVSSYTAYTWQAKTCNSKVCSAASSDSFTVFNTAPTAPALPDINYTGNTYLSLTWNSGTDSDTAPVDTLHDELQFSNVSDFSALMVDDASATSAKTVYNLTSFSTYYWRVRTCDDTGASNDCSSWATDSFFTYNCSEVPAEQCPTCTSCPSCSCGTGGSSGGGGSYTSFSGGGGGSASYAVILMAPPELAQGDSFAFLVNFRADRNLGNVSFRLDTPSGITSKKTDLLSYEGNAEKLVLLSGRIADNLPLGKYTFKFIVAVNGIDTVQTGFFVVIKKKVPTPFCGDSICDESESADTCIQDCHCGNGVCESEFGEENACIRDCQLTLAPFVFWVTALVIAMSALVFYVYKDLSHSTKELASYIKNSLKRGERPEDIRKKLIEVGYPNKRITEVYEAIRKKYNAKVAQMMKQKRAAQQPQKPQQSQQQRQQQPTRLQPGQQPRQQQPQIIKPQQRLPQMQQYPNQQQGQQQQKPQQSQQQPPQQRPQQYPQQK